MSTYRYAVMGIALLAGLASAGTAQADTSDGAGDEQTAVQAPSNVVDRTGVLFANSSFEVATGADYSVGHYGASVDTTVWSIPVDLKARIGHLRLQASLPYEFIDGPGKLVGGVIVSSPLKGPQGSLYGTGALAGIYRLVSRHAEMGGTSLALSSGLNGVAHGEAGYSGSAVANLQLLPDTAALRLVGYVAEDPGWIDTGRRSNANSTRVTGARALLGLVPGIGWRLDLTGFGQWIEARDSSYVYAKHSLSRPDQRPEAHDNDLRHLAGRLTGGIGDVDLLLASAMTSHDLAGDLDATVGVDGFGIVDPQTLRDSRSNHIWDSDLRLRGQIGTLSWLAGLSHLEARQSQIVSLKGVSGAQVIASDDRRISHDSAAYFNLTLPIATSLSVDGGGGCSARRSVKCGPCRRAS